ncbi:MAG: hypothetical protein B7X86_07180 [Sphingobacteriales bacterium 17-39-43]|uniref:DUF4292 domain-containing protein n=1 Tax=Daejeonella sp. TaxID=2805397 RepID=UPI000BD8B604|nr:DUF4292 domain-containing protein [Daejeonella sp.]OYZ31848.1 MAG: hypothetical protein B7Y24_08445 [Sphingobacteriales bacterium 16-39-50]OZA24827.1 MAG: hypothetical protein B7X86_07180 [Sphingobacteriales bacterium 17-39-43]HQS05583.1 DUF4292 domain-containing protein [Daejeonella sp.]HQT23009.1 DUF4292 domain-containing protein [Daejeonella sp.]HQT57141.1 DUF4292 domain-containing protein [Daejeonella sp.]
MKKNILINTVYVLVLLFALTSCKAKKVILPVAAVPESPAVSAEADNTRKNKLKSINESDMVFNTLAVKSKAVLSINDKSNDVNMNFRIKNNEVIWVSITALAGLEVARALITPDSVKILNRLDNVYIKKPFSYIYEFTNEQINFRTLQSILIGNTVSEFITDSTELNMESDEAKLRSILGGLTYNLRVSSQNKVVYTNLNDQIAKQELTANYSDFILVNQQQIPHTVVMDSKVKTKKFLLDLKFLKVDLDGPLELPFRVPERFLIKN